MATEYIGNKIYNSIETDENVTENLSECLYCYVISRYKDNGTKNTDYKVPLINITEGFRQCPSCKRIFIVKNFLPE